MGLPPSPSNGYTTTGRTALVVGHPGHELKLFGWVKANRPRVYVITDGSGRTGIPRLSSTARLLAQIGSPPGEIFGCLSDAGIYRAIIECRIPIFLQLVDALKDSFVLNQIDFVAGDAMEGFNPTHDLCRAITNAAVLIAEHQGSKLISNYEFFLDEQECNCHKFPGQCLHFDLEREALGEKLAAARQYVEMKDDVIRAIAKWGQDNFRIECLRRVAGPLLTGAYPVKRHYELWGEQRVREGEYESVIRYHEHVLPILNALYEYAIKGAAVAA